MSRIIGECLILSKKFGVPFWSSMDQPLDDIIYLLPLAFKEAERRK